MIRSLKVPPETSFPPSMVWTIPRSNSHCSGTPMSTNLQGNIQQLIQWPTLTPLQVRLCSHRNASRESKPKRLRPAEHCHSGPTPGTAMDSPLLAAARELWRPVDTFRQKYTRHTI